MSPEKKKTPAKPKSSKKGKKLATDKVNEEAEADDENTGSGDPAGTVTDIPLPFAPSVTRILKTKPLSQPPPDLPSGLSVATLKSRLSGKKVK